MAKIIQKGNVYLYVRTMLSVEDAKRALKLVPGGIGVDEYHIHENIQGKVRSPFMKAYPQEPGALVVFPLDALNPWVSTELANRGASVIVTCKFDCEDCLVYYTWENGRLVPRAVYFYNDKAMAATSHRDPMHMHGFRLHRSPYRGIERFFAFQGEDGKGEVAPIKNWKIV